jgi:hypothetical protein
MKATIIVVALSMGACPGFGARHGSAAEYLGGTLTTINPHTTGWLVTTDPAALAFESKKSLLRVPYDRINQIEYGQKAERRILEGVLLSPLFVLAKRRDHYVTVGFEMEDGRQQALLFRVEKDDVRALLVGLEARTGRKITYQDDEARKAGK